MPVTSRPGYPFLRAPTRTITFTGAANLGAVGSPITIWTLTGRVHLVELYQFVSTAMASTLNTGTIACGTAASTEDFFAAFTVGAGVMATGDWFDGSVSVPEIGDGMMHNGKVLNANLIFTIATNPITSGVLVVDGYYMPLTAGASLA